MKEWWVSMLTVMFGVFAATAAFVRPAEPMKGKYWLLASWICGIVALIGGSLKLWGWSSAAVVKGSSLSIRLRNCLHPLAEDPLTSLIAYGCFLAAFVCLLRFGWLNLKFAH